MINRLTATSNVLITLRRDGKASRRSVIGTVALALVALPLPMAAADDSPPPATNWVPQHAVLALDIEQPKAILDFALSPKLVASVTSSAPYRNATDQPKWREFQGGIAFMEARLGVSWRDALHKLLDGGVHLSVHPQEGLILIIDAEDGQLLNKVHDVFVEMAKSDAAKAGQSERVKSREYQGATIWTFSGQEAHAILGKRLLLSNRPTLLKEALDLCGKKSAGLAALSSYQAARKAAGGDAAATAFINMKAIKQVPDIQKLLSKSDNPLAALLFAAVTDALRGSQWLGLGLDVRADGLALRAAVDGKATDHASPAAFAIPQQGGKAMPNLAVPGFIAGLSLYRDLHGFYAAKDQLFPERTSGLIFFENMMGIFFSGKDLTDEVLAETRPEIRVVVAQQKYDPAIGTPRTQLPAFGIVFRLRDPEKVGQMWEEAWQKAVGLVNFTRGQKAEPGLIIDHHVHNGVRISVAGFAATASRPATQGNRSKEKTDVDIRYNFRPALACPGNYLLLTSTDGLAQDLIDALKKEIAAPSATNRLPHSLLDVDGARLASMLQVNREAMVRSSMVEKGKTEAQAQGEFELMVTVLRYFGRATLDIGSADGCHDACLNLKLSPLVTSASK
jgi:hypothetical protein